MRRTRVLVADSFALFRAGVRHLLGHEGDFDVVEATDLASTIAIARATRPDVALVDLTLPPNGAVEAVRKLAEISDTQSIVWSFGPTQDIVLAAVRAGAAGFLDKRVSGVGLVRALRGLSYGEAPISRNLTTLMIEALHGLDRRERARERAALLSARELEVLELVARGARNRDIADRLAISEFTVKRHVQNILEKLELPTRRAAASFYETAFGREPELIGA
jgi:DNA-binding NarL/FixJ family response regulator